MNNVVFIADFFSHEISGGGELNNEELIRIFDDLGHNVEKKNSHLVDINYIETRSQSLFIVANFMNLSKQVKISLYDKKYLIYEHDHKYLANRNPAAYKNYEAPREKIINYEFYKNAIAIVCQSKFQETIVEKNSSP
jgi:hypothetical protein